MNSFGSYILVGSRSSVLRGAIFLSPKVHIWKPKKSP